MNIDYGRGVNQTPMEKRKNARIPISMRVESTQIEPIGFGYAFNLSESGLGVDAQALIHEGALLQTGSSLCIKFKLPSSEYYVSATVEVIYCEKISDLAPKIGLKFLKISPEAQEHIKTYLNQRK